MKAIETISTIPYERTGLVGEFVNIIEPQVIKYLVLQPWDRGSFRDQDCDWVDRIWFIGVRQKCPTHGGDFGTELLSKPFRNLLTAERARERAARFASDYVAVVVECTVIMDGELPDQITPVRVVTRPGSHFPTT